jgi:hypothetical protein
MEEMGIRKRKFGSVFFAVLTNITILNARESPAVRQLANGRTARTVQAARIRKFTEIFRRRRVNLPVGALSVCNFIFVWPCFVVQSN